MKAYTSIPLPVIKLNVSSPEGDDNKKVITVACINSFKEPCKDFFMVCKFF
jgi:hypothetical protein